MILGDELRGLPTLQPAGGQEIAADLRKMALHLETAAALELKARKATDPTQTATLRRRADQRRRQAARIRARLAASGAVTYRHRRVPPPVEGW